jgi:hypothetical protein
MKALVKKLKYASWEYEQRLFQKNRRMQFSKLARLAEKLHAVLQ